MLQYDYLPYQVETQPGTQMWRGLKKTTSRNEILVVLTNEYALKLFIRSLNLYIFVIDNDLNI